MVSTKLIGTSDSMYCKKHDNNIDPESYKYSEKIFNQIRLDDNWVDLDVKLAFKELIEKYEPHYAVFELVRKGVQDKEITSLLEFAGISEQIAKHLIKKSKYRLSKLL